MSYVFRLTTRSGETVRLVSETKDFIIEIDGQPVVGLQNAGDEAGDLGTYPDGEHFSTISVVSFQGPVVGDAVDRVDTNPLDDEDLQTDLDSMKSWAPWTSAESFALNVFQKRGNFHPFTCPKHEGEGEVLLIATMDGWVCSKVPTCEYTQDWAWTAMFDAKNWLTTTEIKNRPWLKGCVCTIRGVDGSWRITGWNKLCTKHPQLKDTHLDPETQMVLASRPMHVSGPLEVLREVGVPETAEEFDERFAKGTPVSPIDFVIDKKGLQQLSVQELTELFTDDALFQLKPNLTDEQWVEIQDRMREDG
jgi:hypothetical protein